MENYVCGDCGASGVKLWRNSAVFNWSLRCCDCAAKFDKVDPDGVDAAGRRTDRWGHRTDQFPMQVPAVPADDKCESMWGYTSVPKDRMDWWRGLPLRVRASKIVFDDGLGEVRACDE